jgi:hypothetical protein
MRSCETPRLTPQWLPDSPKAERTHIHSAGGSVLLKKVILGCFPAIAIAAVVWWSGIPGTFNTQVPVADAYATVDDVYAALFRQMGGASPDFETQVEPTLALHLTYSELQVFVDEGHHAPTPTPAPTSATAAQAQTTAPPVIPTAIITVVNVAWGPCTTPAKAGLPGWIDCAGTVNLKVNRPVSSGFVTVTFDYPDGGSFFHGGLEVDTNIGTFPVPVINTYISHCVTPFAATVVVRDGPTGGPILLSQPITLTSTTCG